MKKLIQLFIFSCFISITYLQAQEKKAGPIIKDYGKVWTIEEKMKVVLVVHNKASKDLITDAAYQERYKTNNPNAELIQDLMNAGTEVIFCGQSSLSRDFPREELLSGVQMALSAMTALIHFQEEGYQLIKF